MKITTPTQSAEVHYTIEILDATGRVARQLPRKRNLILDQGLDGIAVRSWAASFTCAAIGTGTTPTKRDSGAITFTRAGSTVTSSSGFFEAADVGRLLKFDSGEEVRISAYTDAQTVITSTSGIIAAAEGTIWYVNQTGLTAETKRTASYSNDVGANGSTFTGPGTWTHKRTFIFSAEAGTILYREIGWSYDLTAGANLFGRDLLPGAGVSLVAGQQLRVIVELSVAYAPSPPGALASVVTGWSASGTHGVTFSDLHLVATSGGAGGPGDALEPHVSNKRIALSASAAAVGSMSAARGTYPPDELGEQIASGGAYTAGSFSRTWSGTFATTQANSASIRTICLGQIGGDPSLGREAYRVLLDANEAKNSSQSLTLVFRLSWGRVLNNA